MIKKNTHKTRRNNMTQLNFNDELTVKTVFGTVKVIYVERAIDKSMVAFGGKEKITESHYHAIILDGKFNGWDGTSIGSRDGAVSNLLKAVANRYARDEVAKTIRDIES